MFSHRGVHNRVPGGSPPNFLPDPPTHAEHKRGGGRKKHTGCLTVTVTKHGMFCGTMVDLVPLFFYWHFDALHDEMLFTCVTTFYWASYIGTPCLAAQTSSLIRSGATVNGHKRMDERPPSLLTTEPPLPPPPTQPPHQLTSSDWSIKGEGGLSYVNTH